MESPNDPLVDRRGRVMFQCILCGEAIARIDILESGLRLPDDGETAEEYLDAQLLDGVEHAQCPAAVSAG